MTDAPDAVAPETADPVEPIVAAWRAQLARQTSLSASEVQDHLLDLWAQLEEGERRSRVESWLTETLTRHLYTASDLEERLASL